MSGVTADVAAEAATAPFDGVYYEDSLPLEFLAGPLPEPARQIGLNADNFQLLIADASLDEARVPSSESKSDDDAQVLEDIRRLEHKVNVLVQLVAKLVTREQSTPGATPWRLYAGGVEWRGSGAEPAGTTGQVVLYISRQFPQPLRLSGALVASRTDEHGEWRRFVFRELSVPVIDGLERLIFRHHRRAVAGVRTHPRD